MKLISELSSSTPRMLLKNPFRSEDVLLSVYVFNGCKVRALRSNLTVPRQESSFILTVSMRVADTCKISNSNGSMMMR